MSIFVITIGWVCDEKYAQKSVQLVRGSSFRSDFLQNPYFSICTATALHEEERKKKRERNPIYNRFFNKVVVIVFLFTGL